MTSLKCPWCGENHPTETIRMGEIDVSTCLRLGAHEAVMLAPAHRFTSAEFEALSKMSEPIAQVRLDDGSQVVAFAPAGLEVRAFGVEGAIRVVDLDERGLPKEKP